MSERVERPRLSNPGAQDTDGGDDVTSQYAVDTPVATGVPPCDVEPSQGFEAQRELVEVMAFFDPHAVPRRWLLVSVRSRVRVGGRG